MKKLFSFILCICMLMGLSVPYTAYAVESSGKIYKYLYPNQYAGTWALGEDGILTISGEGELGDLADFDNYGDVIKIVFNEGVKSFAGDSSIGNFDNMKEIEVCSSIMVDFCYWFCHCDSLEKVTITSDNEYMTVVDGVVYDKAKTKILLYPRGLKNKTYTVPEKVTGVKHMGWSISISNQYIEEIVLHNKVTDISIDCPNLKEMKVPDSVESLYVGESIPDYALHDNGLYYLGNDKNPYRFLIGYDENISQVNISDKTKIVSCCFSSPNIVTLTIPDNVNIIDGILVGSCENLTEINLGSGIVGLDCQPHFTYGYLPNLRKVSVSDNFGFITWDAFFFTGDGKFWDGIDWFDRGAGFYFLGNDDNPYVALCSDGGALIGENVVLPEGIKSVACYNPGRYGVYFPNIKTIQIPESLTYISEGAFYGSENLTDVYYAEIEICEGNEDLLNANIHFGKKDVQDVTVANIPAKTYGDDAFALDVTDNSTALGALTYTSSNTDVATVSADGTVTVKAAGTTNITISRAGNEQYADFSVTKPLTVNKKAITITAKSYTIRQNNVVPTLEYDITAGELVSGDSITGALSVNADGTRLGEFDITQGTLTAGANYALTFVKGKLSVVDKTPQEIVVVTIGEKTYGDADFAVSVTPDATANLSAFAYASSNTDVAEISADGTVTIKAAGETDITVTEPGNSDYASFSSTQKLVVNKKNVTVTSVDLDAKTAVLDGVLVGDTAVALNFDKLVLEVTGEVDETTSNVKVTGFELVGDKSENYTVTTTELNTTIAVANMVTVTVTADGGTVTGAGSYIKGNSVTVTATPIRGFAFTGWQEGETTVSTDATYTFVADADKELVAKFVKQATGGGDSTYTVNFETNGGSKVSSKSVRKNTSVTEPAMPSKKGYTFAGWYSDADFTTPYDFSDIVKKDMTLYAKWTADGTVEPEPTEKPEEPATTPFNDVKADAWYADAVKFAVENGLMNGVSDTEFAPNATLTRAMLVTILYRNDGEPETADNTVFEDVATGSYYEKAVAWAKANGIVDGYSETEFAPDANITREQIATIMHRYATYKNYDVNGSADILDREDYAEISDYAVSAMQYMVASGLMNGKTNTTLEPQDKATRAEIATILQRFITSNN